eukprot:4739496-Pyramimonas_sp.AAC.1
MVEAALVKYLSVIVVVMHEVPSLDCRLSWIVSCKAIQTMLMPSCHQVDSFPRCPCSPTACHG